MKGENEHQIGGRKDLQSNEYSDIINDVDGYDDSSAMEIEEERNFY